MERREARVEQRRGMRTVEGGEKVNWESQAPQE